MQENCIALHGGAGYGVIAGLGIQPTFTLTSSIYQNKLQSAAFKSGITLTAMVSLTPKLVFLPDGSVGLRQSFWSLDLSTHSTCWALCSEAQVGSNTCLQHTETVPRAPGQQGSSYSNGCSDGISLLSESRFFSYPENMKSCIFQLCNTATFM